MRSHKGGIILGFLAGYVSACAITAWLVLILFSHGVIDSFSHRVIDSMQTGAAFGLLALMARTCNTATGLPAVVYRWRRWIFKASLAWMRLFAFGGATAILDLFIVVLLTSIITLSGVRLFGGTLVLKNGSPAEQLAVFVFLFFSIPGGGAIAIVARLLAAVRRA